MKRKQALSLYLAGTLGQILLVSLLVWLIKQLFHLICYLYKDQKPLALCHDTCANQLSVATVIS